jgi:hypothetical protein
LKLCCDYNTRLRGGGVAGVKFSWVGAIIAYLLTEGAVGKGGGHSEYLRLPAESRGRSYALKT